MSKQQDPGYKPLSMHARWKLNRAVKALRSPFHSVRAAAHREIQKILAKAQQRGQRIQKAVKEKLKREPRQRSDRPARPPRPKRHRCSCGKSFHSREFFNAHARKHAREGRQVPARSRQARSQQAAQPARALLTPKDLKARQRARKQAAKAARKAPAPAGRVPAPAASHPQERAGKMMATSAQARQGPADGRTPVRRPAPARSNGNAGTRPAAAPASDAARARQDAEGNRRRAADLRKRAEGARSRGLKEYPALLEKQAAQADARARQYARQAAPVRVAPPQRGKSPAGRPAETKGQRLIREAVAQGKIPPRAKRPKTRQQEGLAARKPAPQTRTYIGQTTKQAGKDQRNRTADQAELRAQRQRPRTPTPAQARAARAPASRPAPRPASVPSLRPDRPRVPLPHQTVGAPSVRAPRAPGTRRIKVPFRRSR